MAWTNLITTLASAWARMRIWLVADCRPDHVAAVSWLNETSQASFYLLKVEAFRIDDSPLAPLMSLVAGLEQSGDLPPKVRRSSRRRQTS